MSKIDLLKALKIINKELSTTKVIEGNPSFFVLSSRESDVRFILTSVFLNLLASNFFSFLVDKILVTGTTIKHYTHLCRNK